MSSAALLLILVLSPSSEDPAALSLERAAREVLGPSASVRLERLAAPVSDGAAIERAGQAGGVVEVVWEQGRESVRLHCYIASDQRWVDRTIVFNSSDREEERGRLLGFAVGSMYTDAASFAEQGQEDEVDPGAATGLEVVPVVPARPLERSVADQPSVVPAPQGSAGPSPRSLSFAVQVTSPAAGGDTSPELGAAVAFGWGFAPRLALRLGASARMGEIPAAQANLRRFDGALGIAWELLRPTSALELTLRSDAIAGWIQVAHLSSDDVERVHHHRWVAGADAVFDVGYRLSALTSIGVGVGLEALGGSTHVYTHGREVATVPPWHRLAELQFRTQF